MQVRKYVHAMGVYIWMILIGSSAHHMHSDNNIKLLKPISMTFGFGLLVFAEILAR